MAKPEDAMKVTVSQLRPAAAWVTDVGNVRTNNEDSLHVDERLGVFLVADGMGGRQSGEIASRLAKETIVEDMAAAREQIVKVRFGEKEPEVVRRLLAQAIKRACAVVYAYAQDNPGSRGMGCTVTVLVTLGDHALMGHVGDSRLYLVREGYMHQLSTDYTMAAELLRAGALTEEQAAGSKLQHQLTRAVGTQPTVQVETLLLPVRARDRFLICSDGISNEVTDAEILQLLTEEEAAAASHKMLELVLSRTASDNATGVVVEVAGNPFSQAVLGAQDQALGALEELFLCRGLVIKDLARVLSYADVNKLEPGQRLFEEGDQLEQMVVCISGALQLERGGETVRVVRDGGFVGESTLMRGRPARASLVATEASLVMELPGPALRRLAKRKPALGATLFNSLALRLSRALDVAWHRLEELEDPQTLSDPTTGI